MAEQSLTPQSMEYEHWPCAILTRDITTPLGTFEKGTMYALHASYDQKQLQEKYEISALSLDDNGKEVTIPSNFLKVIDDKTKDLLRAISKAPRRLTVLEDSSWLDEGKAMAISDQVLLNHQSGLPPDAVGMIRFKGKCSGKKGIYFGVELDDEYAGKGSSDGAFRKVRYFRCRDDCGVFVSIYNVRLNKETGIPSVTSSTGTYDGITEPPFDLNLLTSSSSVNLSSQAPIRMPPQHSNHGSSSSNSILNRIEEAVVKSEAVPATTQMPLPATTQMPLPATTQMPLPAATQMPLPPPPPPPAPQTQTQNLDGFLRSDLVPGSGVEQRSRAPRYHRNSAHSGSSSTAISHVNLQGPGEGSVVEVPLKVGDRIVWVSDEGAHRGVVRWIGQPGELDEDERQVTAGVQLDQKKGTGTGRYKGRDLFTAPKGYAALMPLIGLMKEEDYDGGVSNAASALSERCDSADDPDIKRAIAMSLKEQGRSTTQPKGNNANIHQASTVSLKTDDSFPIARPPPHNAPVSYQDSYIGEGVRRKSTNRFSSTNSPSSGHSQPPAPQPPPNATGALTIGSRVEVLQKKYGVIKWIGKLETAPDPTRDMAGMLMEDRNESLYTAGTFRGQQLFDAPPNSALFIYLHNCRPDTRQLPQPQQPKPVKERATRAFTRSTSQDTSFTSMDSMVSIPDSSTGNLQQYVGKPKGIEGKEGMSGLISLLYSWFQFTDAFDFALARGKNQSDVACFKKVKDILKNDIVKPLRISGKVFAEKIEDLYSILQYFAQATMKYDITKAYPENYITLIMAELLKCERFITFSNESAMDYLLIGPSTAGALQSLQLPSTQHILEAELCAKRMKFDAVPKALHLVCKLERVHPLLEISLEGLVEGTGHICKLHLSAVLAHAKNRFIAYAKCFKGVDSPWVKFDSMAASVQMENGRVFVPQVTRLDEITEWLSPSYRLELIEKKRADLAEDLQNLCLNTYMCIYVKE